MREAREVACYKADDPGVMQVCRRTRAGKDLCCRPAHYPTARTENSSISLAGMGVGLVYLVRRVFEQRLSRVWMADVYLTDEQEG